MPSVDLNIDLGELPGEPDELFALATTANVACGGHAGDAASMERAVRLALAHGAEIAAHPSYPDRAGFGRKTIAMEAGAIREAVAAQCAALSAIARRLGATVRRMKPHGALYHDASRDPAIAAAVVEGARRGLAVEAGELTIVGPAVPGGAEHQASESGSLLLAPRPSGSGVRSHGDLQRQAEAVGARYAREGFADRGYRGDGSLVPRSEAGALITDPEAAARQAITLVRSGGVDTICVHGDTRDAVAIATRVRAALAGEGVLR